jgi:hypothetical protein
MGYHDMGIFDTVHDFSQGITCLGQGKISQPLCGWTILLTNHKRHPHYWFPCHIIVIVIIISYLLIILSNSADNSSSYIYIIINDHC